MTRVILHTGFHKTGTTTLQRFMMRNRDALAPFCIFWNRAELASSLNAARRYGRAPNTWRLFQFRRAFRADIKTLPKTETLVLSREAFSGGVPGFLPNHGPRVLGYTQTAPRLAKVIIEELQNRLGTDTEISFFYTLREREAWISSLYKHHLRTSRMTDSFETFIAALPPDLCTAKTATFLKSALAPHSVTTARLEEYQKGPNACAPALLDLLNVPKDVRNSLQSVSQRNVSQPIDLNAEFLRLNGSNLSDAEVIAQKHALMNPDQGA